MLEQYKVPFIQNGITPKLLTECTHPRHREYLNLFPTLMHGREDFKIYDDTVPNDDSSRNAALTMVKVMSRQVRLCDSIFAKDWSVGSMLDSEVPCMSIVAHKDAQVDKWILENVDEYFIARKFRDRGEAIGAQFPLLADDWFMHNQVQFPSCTMSNNSIVITSTNRNRHTPKVTLIQPWLVDRTQNSWTIPKRFWHSILKCASEIPSNGIRLATYVDPLLELYLFRYIVDLPLNGVSMRDAFGPKLEKLTYDLRESLFVPIYERYTALIAELKIVTQPIRTDLDFIHFNVTEMKYETRHSNRYLFTDLAYQRDGYIEDRSLEEMSHCAIRPREEWEKMYRQRNMKQEYEELRHCKRVRIIFMNGINPDYKHADDYLPRKMVVVLDHDPSCMVCLKGLSSWYQAAPYYSPYKFIYTPLENRKWTLHRNINTNRLWKERPGFSKFTFNNAAYLTKTEWFNTYRGGIMMNELELKVRGHCQFYEPLLELMQCSIDSDSEEYIVAQGTFDTPNEVRTLFAQLQEKVAEECLKDNESHALGGYYKDQSDTYYLEQVAKGMHPVGLTLESYSRKKSKGYGRDYVNFKQAMHNEEINRKRERAYEDISDEETDTESGYIAIKKAKREVRRVIYSHLENRDLMKGIRIEAIENYISTLQ